MSEDKLEITVETLNLSDRVSVSEANLARVVEAVLLEEAGMGTWQVTLVLTTDDHLRDLHARFLGVDELTDVMTFPSGDDAIRGGEVIISVDRAIEQASDAGHSTEDEIRYLVAHGILHLTGWLDDTTEARRRMLGRQDQLLQLRR